MDMKAGGPAGEWVNTWRRNPRRYVCGYCGERVASDVGYGDTNESVHLYVCPNCGNPTYFNYAERQIPGVRYGNDVSALPNDVESLYNEARDCVAASAYTSAVLVCRKLLMNMAVSKGAEEGKPFVDYVSHLASKGYVPPDGEAWVDLIRQKGNEANHEIRLMSEQDAKDIITFLEMLLKFIFEFPSKVSKPTPTPPPTGAV